MRKKNLYLFITAVIWGFNYIPQHLAMDSVGPLLFSVCRFGLAASFMGVVYLFNKNKKNKKQSIKAGIICGCVLFVASVSQQIGLVYCDPGKASFISCLYIIFVPLFALLFYREKPTIKLWFCVIFALAGLYLLTVKSEFGITSSDLYVLLSAIIYAIHIILIDKYADEVNVYLFNFFQFIVVALFSLIGCLFVKQQCDVVNILPLIAMVFYAGVISTGIAYTVQTIGQANNDPTIASLILSLESPFALIFGIIFLNETLTRNEVFGCLLIAVAIVALQLPDKNEPNNQ